MQSSSSVENCGRFCYGIKHKKLQYTICTHLSAHLYLECGSSQRMFCYEHKRVHCSFNARRAQTIFPLQRHLRFLRWATSELSAAAQTRTAIAWHAILSYITKHTNTTDAHWTCMRSSFAPSPYYKYTRQFIMIFINPYKIMFIQFSDYLCMCENIWLAWHTLLCFM